MMNKNKIEVILCIIGIALTIGLIVLLILLTVKKPKKLSLIDYKDIYITGLLNINFNQDFSKTDYSPSNLGSTGRPILDCYIGTCTKKEIVYFNYQDCEEGSCDTYESSRIEIIDKYDYDCSKECYTTKKQTCNCSFSESKLEGKCSRNIDDNEYESGKYCFSDNVIYYWKGKRYQNESISEYSYLKNCITKDEECPSRTKNCGIIDDYGNKLCISIYKDCPINYLSDKKFDEKHNYSTVIIGNKTFYYTHDENNENRKIIKGLVADTDLYLNNDNDKKVVIDTYTISGLLNDNKNLYKGINLGYNPYTLKDIDKKGKSYLRYYYNSDNVDLIELRKKKDLNVKNENINSINIKPINDDVSLTIKFGFTIFGYLLIVFILNILLDCSNKSGKLIPLFLFLFPMASTLYFSFTINKEFNYLKEDMKKEFNSFKIINILFIIISFILILLIIIFFAYVCKHKYLPANEIISEQSSTIINTTVNQGTNNTIPKK